jgi:hypothetical protein
MMTITIMMIMIMMMIMVILLMTMIIITIMIMIMMIIILKELRMWAIRLHLYGGKEEMEALSKANQAIAGYKYLCIHIYIDICIYMYI